MISINFEKCKHCTVCINRFKGYCISNENGNPKIDYMICNQCQKCIAICPHQAILMNGKQPIKIEEPLRIVADDLKEFLKRRRSIKKFKDCKIPREVLLEIASVAKYAPNQNKNIEIIIIDDLELINKIDRSALKFVLRLYNIFFSMKFLTSFIQLFSDSLPTIKKKMEFDLHINKHVVKENTQGLYLLIGNPKVPVTESSAQYLLSTMIIYAEALGIGSCLMDSLKLSINRALAIKNALRIPKGNKVLGVLAVGYSNECIVNIPQGYEINTSWNRKNTETIVE